MNKGNDSQEYENSPANLKLNSSTPKIQYLVLEPDGAGNQYQSNDVNAVRNIKVNKSKKQSDESNNKLHNQNTRVAENILTFKVKSTSENRPQERFEEETNLLNNMVSLKSLDLFMCSNLDIHETPEDKLADRKVNSHMNWTKINSNPEEVKSAKEKEEQEKKSKSSNIILKNKILKMENSPFSLRTVGVEIEISVLMAGESNIWIFSRCKENISLDTVVCNISKEQKSTRKFISFAILDTCNEDDYLSIKTLKKQEVPKLNIYSKELDISEITITIIDNGDRKYSVAIQNANKSAQHKFYSDFFLPVYDLSNVMIGATGDLVSFKNITVKQIKRSKYLREDEDGNANSQQCACCKIF